MTQVQFLSVEDVLFLHGESIDIEGGFGGVRDHGLLESAVAMPRQQFGGQYLHEDMAAMAAAYLFHLAQNHPFLDGNKRTAVIAALAFLRCNGVEQLPNPRELESVTLQVAAGQMAKDALADWFRSRIRRRC